MNSRAKGTRGERQCRDQWREAGFTARRTQQYSGTEGTSDVKVEELPWLHIESKVTEKKAFLVWLEQAERDAAQANKVPLVCHRRNGRKGWIAILPLENLIDIIRRSDLVKSRSELETPKWETGTLMNVLANDKKLPAIVQSASGLGNNGI